VLDQKIYKFDIEGETKDEADGNFFMGEKSFTII